MSAPGIKISVAAAVALAAVATGKMVEIKVKTPPDIDPSQYRRVAVLPFEGEGDKGLLAAAEMQKVLEAKRLFQVEAADTVQDAVDRGGDYDAGSREAAVAVGKALGVDLVLLGQVKFYERSFSPEGSTANELYTADRGSIPPFEFGSSYAQRSLDLSLKYTVELTVKAIRLDTGRLIRRREFEATTLETYKKSEVSFDPQKEKEIYLSLLKRAVADFVYTLDTHDVTAKREVVEF